MRTATLLTFTLLTFGACAGCQSTQSSLAQEHMLTSRHAALVDTLFGTGTGFPIRDDAFLTAWHVVVGSKPEDVSVNGWQVLEIERVGELDAAILYTGLHGEEPWPLADRAPRAGETVFKSGYGQGVHWWTEGIGTEDADRVAIDIFHGDSGGPLFDDRGNVLGVIVTVGAYGFEGRIMHHAGIVPMTLILDAMPEGFFDPQEPEAELPPLAPAPETPWETFQRLKKERGL